MAVEIVRKVLILGGGSAGLLASIAIKSKVPSLDVTVLRSLEIGVIGVGEGTTISVPNFLHGRLRIPPGEFVREVRPTYKLGLKFLWGPRPYFNYTLDPQFNGKYSNLSHEPGFYCDQSIEYASLTSAMMTHDKVFIRTSDGMPALFNNHAYHFENAKLVQFLEMHAAKIGVIFEQDVVKNVAQDENGVKFLSGESGRNFDADLFVDCSGFQSLLLGRTLAEPFVSFRKSLFCDRAVVGGWDRSADEVIRPYTTCETMDAGWCWRIDHESRINRGYVYAADFISDEHAELEFRRKNPRVERTRIVKFISGAHERAWVKNVVAIGNALGFVEPMEATALAGICQQADSVSQALLECGGRLTAAVVGIHNKVQELMWDEIRDFLAVHYKYNTRLNTEFWKAARQDVEIGEAEEYTNFYEACGPTKFWMNTLMKNTSIFGAEGYLCMMVGMKVPYRNEVRIDESERKIWDVNRRQYQAVAMNGYNMHAALKMLRQPDYPWDAALYNLLSL